MKKWKIIVSIVITTNTLALFGIIAALPTINLHLLDCHIIREGIDKYHDALSSVGLCSYLTVRDERKKTKEEYFTNKFQYMDSFFKFEETYNGGYEHEVVIMHLTYDALTFSDVLNDIKNQPGFSEEISFQYKNYSFFLNQTEKLVGHIYTDFDISSSTPYLNWINLVGFSNDDNCIVFIGFYHIKQWRSGFWKYDEEYYSFEGWVKFIEKEFPYL